MDHNGSMLLLVTVAFLVTSPSDRLCMTPFFSALLRVLTTRFSTGRACSCSTNIPTTDADKLTLGILRWIGCSTSQMWVGLIRVPTFDPQFPPLILNSLPWIWTLPKLLVEHLKSILIYLYILWGARVWQKEIVIKTHSWCEPAAPRISYNTSMLSMRDQCWQRSIQLLEGMRCHVVNADTSSYIANLSASDAGTRVEWLSQVKTQPGGIISIHKNWNILW